MLLRGSLARLFSAAGSRRVKHLACLLEAPSTGNLDHNHISSIKEFKRRHNLTDRQFLDLANVLGTDYQTVLQLAGNKELADRLFERKLRDAGVSRSSTETVDAAVSALRRRYADLQSVLTPNQARREVLGQLAGVFGVSNSTPRGSLGNPSSSTLAAINSRLSILEEQSISKATSDAEKEELRGIFAGIRNDINSNTEEFLADTAGWIQSSLNRESNNWANTLPSQTEKAQSAPTRVVTTQNLPNYQNYYTSQILSTITADEDGRTLLVESEHYIDKLPYCPNIALLTSTSAYAYLLLAGTLPLSVIAAYPLLAYFCNLLVHLDAKSYVPRTIIKVLPVVSQIYARGNLLDVVVKRNGVIVDTVESVKAEDLKFVPDQEATVDVPWQLRLLGADGGRVPLWVARNKGFPANLSVITIKGKQYYIDGGYRANKDALRTLNIVA